MRLINADELEYMQIGTNAYVRAEDIFSATPVDTVQVVRCKDCKHRPIGTNRDDLEFPDDKCPCKCEDYWYSWKPSDNWFCGNGERKDDEAEEITSIIGRDATTVDAVPVRHGRWVSSDSPCGIACSVCGVPVDDFCCSVDYIDMNYQPNFCPNCGADMRKDGEHHD